MNMHHITKSLFVGAAIAGIGMSSGRAEIPLSGETRAWNATVKKLEPLFEGTGFKLDGDRLRRLITEYFFYNFRVHGVGPFSFKQFAEGVRPKDPKIADLKYSWSYCLGRCLAGCNMTVGDAQSPIQGKLKSCYEEGCNFNIGAMILVERKLILCPTYSEKEGVSFREAALRTKSPGYVDIKFVNGTTGDAFLLRTQFGYFFDRLMDFLVVVNFSTPPSPPFPLFFPPLEHFPFLSVKPFDPPSKLPLDNPRTL